MSITTKTVLANIGLSVLGIYGAVGVVYFYGWWLPFIGPVVPVLMAHFLLIPVGLLYICSAVLIPMVLLVLAMLQLTIMVHRFIGLKCCE